MQAVDTRRPSWDGPRRPRGASRAVCASGIVTGVDLGLVSPTFLIFVAIVVVIFS